MKILKKTMAALVVSSMLLTGCAPTVNPGPNSDENIISPTKPATPETPTTPQPTAPTMPPLVPMTAEWKQQVEQAWYTVTGTAFGDWEDGSGDKEGVRYYGTYQGYDILFRPTHGEAETHLNVADVTFTHMNTFDIFAYHDGSFKELEELYESEVLSMGDIRILSLTHLANQGYLAETSGPIYSLDMMDQIKLAFLREFVDDPQYTTADLSITYFGEYDGAHVGFVNGILVYTQAMTSETIAGVTFRYSTGQKLLVFFEGELLRLADAYDRGILTKEQLRDLRDAYAPKDDSYVTE